MLDGTMCIDTANEFFRTYHTNNAILSNVIAPAVMNARGPDEPYHILEAGSSRGCDTWSMAAALALRGVAFTINAVDVNPYTLIAAQQPYDTTIRELEKRINAWRLPRGVLDYFEQTGKGHIRPVAELRSRVNFTTLDLRHSIPAANTYDAVVSNNVFCHYHTAEETAMASLMLGNIAASMRPGGLFTFAELTARYRPLTDALLSRHHFVTATGLYDRHTWGDAHFFTHIVTPLRPSWWRRIRRTA